MGYRPQRTALKLTFDQYPGLEVRCRPATTAQVLAVIRLGDEAKDNLDLMRRAWAQFCEVLRSWNLEEEDEDGTVVPVPATLDGLLTLEMGMVEDIVGGWLDAVHGVSVPLGGPSTSGGPSPVESLPMEPLSPAPQSSIMHS